MVRKLDPLPETPSQTAGPYVHIGCLPFYTGITSIYPEDLGASPIRDGVQGRPITLVGTIFDNTGWPIRDAMIETWQADHQGRYPGQDGSDPALTGFARLAIDPETAEFSLATVKPGPVPTRTGSRMAPHISFWIVARGINIGLSTRAYFEDEDNGADPLLARIEHRPRVETLIARKTGDDAYRLDIHLGGPKETVFLDL